MIDVHLLLLPVLAVVFVIGSALPRTMPPVGAFTLIEERREDPTFVVIDVRRPDEFAGGHIRGAINIDSRYIAGHLLDLDRNGTYIVCCQRGGRSAGVGEVMRKAGFREVYEIEGGMSAWTAAGLPVTRD